MLGSGFEAGTDIAPAAFAAAGLGSGGDDVAESLGKSSVSWGKLIGEIAGGEAVGALAPKALARLKGLTDVSSGVDDAFRGLTIEDLVEIPRLSEDASKAGRVFSSPDALVADLANAIESAYPGHVVGVNVPLHNAVGKLVTDADILLRNAVIQVKSGKGTGLTSQLARTLSATKLPVIGYGPKLGGAVVKGIQKKGGLVTKDERLLIDVVKP